MKGLVARRSAQTLARRAPVVPRSLRRAARRRMRLARQLSWSDRVRAVRGAVRSQVDSTWVWSLIAVIVGFAIWQWWPQTFAPPGLRHADSLRAFVGALWQVVAVTVALSAAVITFSFATFAASRFADIGGSLPDFARSSGLLVGIWVGLIALGFCGASLLLLPNTPAAPNDAIDRIDSARAVAATALGCWAVALVLYVLRRSLRAGDREWMQRQLQLKIKGALNGSVAAFVEGSHARAVMRDVIASSTLKAAPRTGPGEGYRRVTPSGSGLVVDIGLRSLVRRAPLAEGASSILLAQSIADVPLGGSVNESTTILWASLGGVSDRAARRIFKVRRAPGEPTAADGLDQLNRLGLVAIRGDETLWYRGVADIYRDALLHVIFAWRRFGATLGHAPGREAVGLGRLSDDLEAQVRQMMDLDRQEMARLATAVPVEVGRLAAEHGDDGVRLARSMLETLGRMAMDAIKRGPAPTATAVRDCAAAGFFELLRAVATGS